MRKAIQAKHLEDDAILDIVALCNAGRMPTDISPGPRWCLTYDLEAEMPEIPPKVILAKCRSLLRRGKMHGCGCGCRGDFYLPGTIWDR